ncbi:MAG: hypothetical protein PHP35_02480, partial [Candidatus Colwellbacteria bacterium]|nr:hypothetical protein [Candidatus Colwellbacteria bacterium]
KCVNEAGKEASSSASLHQRNLDYSEWSILDAKWYRYSCYDANGSGKCEPADYCYSRTEVVNPVFYTCAPNYTCSGTASYPDKASCEAATGKSCYDNESSCADNCVKFSLTANPPTIRKNFESTTITWDGDLGPGTSGTLKEGDSTITNSTSGSIERSPKEDTTYTFNCVNGGRNKTGTVTVTVVNQCTQANLIFTSSKSRVLKNQSATLSWSASNLDPNISCTLNGTPVSKEQASYPVGPISTTTTYRLSCSSGAECTQEKALTVEAYEAGLEEE